MKKEHPKAKSPKVNNFQEDTKMKRLLQKKKKHFVTIVPLNSYRAMNFPCAL